MADLKEKELNAMALTDVKTVDRDALTDLRDIMIDPKLPVQEKQAFFAGQTKNVYVHRIGDFVVKVTYQNEGPGIDDKIEEYLRHLAETHV